MTTVWKTVRLLESCELSHALRGALPGWVTLVERCAFSSARGGAGANTAARQRHPLRTVLTTPSR